MEALADLAGETDASRAGPDPSALWADALLATALVALDPSGFGGLCVRAHAGPVRDRLLEAFHDVVPDGMPVRRMPSHIGDERLLGGLDMPATLKAGRPITQKGLLTEADGGVLIVPMAERLEPLTASRLTQALDQGTVMLERDGLTALLDAKVGLIALDEGIGSEEALPLALADRLAFRCDLTTLSIRDMAEPVLSKDDLIAALPAYQAMETDDELVATLATLATAFGVSSVRSLLFAIRTAKAVAVLSGLEAPDGMAIETAARLVIAPRATRLPAEEAPPPDDMPPEESDPPPPDEGDDQAKAQEEDTEDQPAPDGPLEDRVVEATMSAIPEQLLARLVAKEALGRAGARSQGGQGARRADKMRGRPIGSRQGRLDGRSRLHLIDTLRAAAPWQPLRRGRGERQGLVVTNEDVRVRRFKQREESVTIFVVDASGSAALHRLAEVKGAIELLLAESYARRDLVALIAFRGTDAELVLPPTRSLVRGKRLLAGLPGGGGTPLAQALDAGLARASDSGRAARTPRLVVLTDGQANVGYNPEGGRAQAREDAMMAAKRIAGYGIAALFIDTSPRRNPRAQEFATAMGAAYLPLPHPNAAGLKALIDPDSPVRKVG
ncbi:MAG: magnesium chelatase subunit D [Cohaesibacteraceae bacterium]